MKRESLVVLCPQCEALNVFPDPPSYIAYNAPFACACGFDRHSIGKLRAYGMVDTRPTDEVVT